MTTTAATSPYHFPFQCVINPPNVRNVFQMIHVAEVPDSNNNDDDNDNNQNDNDNSDITLIFLPTSRHRGPLQILLLSANCFLKFLGCCLLFFICLLLIQLQYVLSKAGVIEESVNRELNITRS